MSSVKNEVPGNDDSIPIPSGILPLLKACSIAPLTPGIPPPQNGWERDVRPTAKCVACGYKCKLWCYTCEQGHRLCFKCLTPDSERGYYDKLRARDAVMNGCWHRFSGNLNPKFTPLKKALQPFPQQRDAEMRFALATAQKAANTRAVKAATTSTNVSQHKDTEIKHAQGSSSTPTISDPEGEYRPIGTARRERKLAIRRKHKDEHSRINVSQDDSHLHNGHTVIVGAGIIGLSIALELRQESIRRGMDHSVTVIDIRSGPCQLASGHCNGLLTIDGCPNSCITLAEDAGDAWLQIAARPDAAKMAGFTTAGSSMAVDAERTDNTSKPLWLAETTPLSISGYSQAIGKINTNMYTSWLYNQCQEIDVDFKFRHAISSPRFTDDARLTGVHVTSFVEESESAVEFPCTNVVLAAGAFTASILLDLVPEHSMTIQNNLQTAHWFAIPIDHTSPDLHGNEACLRFPDAAKSEAKLENEVIMLSTAHDHSLTVTGWDARLRNDHLTRKDALNPRPGKTRELRAVVARYLNRGDLDVRERRHLLSSGRCEVSTANDGAPIIDRVPASALGLLTPLGTDDHSLGGIFLCYGFGRYGTLLSPAAARLMVSRMRGFGGNSVDFRLPPHDKVQIRSTGKGKAKIP